MMRLCLSPPTFVPTNLGMFVLERLPFDPNKTVWDTLLLVVHEKPQNPPFKFSTPQAQRIQFRVLFSSHSLFCFIPHKFVLSMSKKQAADPR